MPSRRVQRLEEQNAALRRALHKQASENSRLQIRSQQERDVQRAKVVEATVRELRGRCESLENALAQSTQRVAVFQRESFTLRSLVKFADHPELADAARAEAERLVAQEEVRSLKEQLRMKQRECDAYRSRCGEACDAAEAFGLHVQHLESETARLDAYVKELLADPEGGRSGTGRRAAATVTNLVPADTTAAGAADERVISVSDNDNADDASGSSSSTTEAKQSDSSGEKLNEVDELREQLEAERCRCAALEEAVDALRVGRHLEARADSAAEWATSHGETTLLASFRKVRRLQRITKGENALLTKRVTALVAQNKSLISRLVDLEEETARLRYLLTSHSPATPSHSC